MFKIHKKAQAAMEFLMTYGWAILVILVAVAALAYFGVFSPDRWLPNTCTFGTGFTCGSDMKAINLAAAGTDGQLYMSLINSLGTSISLANINQLYLTQSVNGANCSLAVDETFMDAFPQTMSAGTPLALNWNCPALVGATPLIGQGGRFSGKFTLEYTKAGEAISHTTNGDIAVRVETGIIPDAS